MGPHCALPAGAFPIIQDNRFDYDSASLRHFISVMRMVNVCTIIAGNYLPQARVLAESFAAHNPGGEFVVLLIDDEDRKLEPYTHGLSCRRLWELGLSGREIAELASIYDVTELATAVKPPFLKHLLSEGRDHILYLDPDIKIYDSLAPAASFAVEHGVVLTPHMTTPLPKDGLRVDDVHILSSGIFNLGFIGLGRGADSFIEWWWGKTRRDALVDHEHMMFTDQRWIDYVPAFFRHYILKHVGYNVAYWNLHERDLVWSGDRYLVNQEPLTFFHFSGYSEERPHLLSKHQGDRPRILLSERPAVRRICAEYRADLERFRSKGSAAAYGWDSLASGLTFDRRMRRVYRQGLLEHEQGRAARPPAPFEDEGNFIAWLKEPVAGRLDPRLSRYLYSVYEDRVDLRAAFPNLEGEDCPRYLMWLHSDGVLQEKIPAPLLPSLTECMATGRNSYADPSSLRSGVNLAGYFRAELGVGEAARILQRAMETAGVPYSTVDYDDTASRRNHPHRTSGTSTAPHSVNLVCVNADQVNVFAHAMGPRFFEGRHTVGYWFWELEDFPVTMHAGFDVVDEVWAATRFIADGIERVGRRPVYHVPLALTTPRVDSRMTRDSLKLPRGFLFLFIFDFFSSVQRKNPVAVIDAFKQAFAPGEGPTLLIKTINGDRCLAELEYVRAACADRPDIRVIDGYLTNEQKNSLIGFCDCYVSLHRAEGLGLTIAEAMALGRPVIATAYSGNLEFMTSSNSYLVDYVRSAVPKGCGPYPAGSMWAEPSIDQAAELMRRVVEDRHDAAARGLRARVDIEKNHSLENSAAAVLRRLDAIRQLRIAVAQSTQPGALASEPGPREPLRLPQRVTARDRLFWGFRAYGRLRQIRKLFVQSLRNAVNAENVTALEAQRRRALEVQQRQALERVWSTLGALAARQTQLDLTLSTLAEGQLVMTHARPRGSLQNSSSISTPD